LLVSTLRPTGSALSTLQAFKKALAYQHAALGFARRLLSFSQLRERKLKC
jgi:hypothetical protein